MKILTYEEKLNIVVLALYEAKKLSFNDGKSAELFYSDKTGLTQLQPPDVIAILNKLVDKEEVITKFRFSLTKDSDRLRQDFNKALDEPLYIYDSLRLEPPKKLEENDCLIVSFAETFDDWCKKFIADHPEIESDETFGKNTAPDSNGRTTYKITYNKNRDVCVNSFLLAHLSLGGENEAVFMYLYEHPNQTITREVLEAKVWPSGLSKRGLYKLVDNLHLTPDLRKMFFAVSSDAITFRNPVTPEMLRELNITYPRIYKATTTSKNPTKTTES